MERAFFLQKPVFVELKHAEKMAEHTAFPCFSNDM